MVVSYVETSEALTVRVERLVVEGDELLCYGGDLSLERFALCWWAARLWTGAITIAFGR